MIPFSENHIILFDLAVLQELLLTAVERFASPLRGRGDYWLRLLPELNETLRQETQLATQPPHPIYRHKTYRLSLPTTSQTALNIPFSPSLHGSV